MTGEKSVAWICMAMNSTMNSIADHRDPEEGELPDATGAVVLVDQISSEKDDRPRNDADRHGERTDREQAEAERELRPEEIEQLPADYLAEDRVGEEEAAEDEEERVAPGSHGGERYRSAGPLSTAPCFRDRRRPWFRSPAGSES